MIILKKRDLVIAGLGLGALSAIAVYFHHLGGQEFLTRYMAVLMLAIGLFMLGRGLRKWRLSRKAVINKEDKRGING